MSCGSADETRQYKDSLSKSVPCVCAVPTHEKFLRCAHMPWSDEVGRCAPIRRVDVVDEYQKCLLMRKTLCHAPHATIAPFDVQD